MDARGGDGLFPCPVCTVPTERGFAPNFNMQHAMDLVEVACPECPWKGKGIPSYQDHISISCPSVIKKGAGDLIKLLEDERTKTREFQIENDRLHAYITTLGDQIADLKNSNSSLYTRLKQALDGHDSRRAPPWRRSRSNRRHDSSRSPRRRRGYGDPNPAHRHR